jgi:IclR family pca regulon transcriptional regulator
MTSEPSRARNDTEMVEGLSRGLRIIEAFDETTPSMTLSELSRQTGIAPAAVRRSVRTLCASGYMRQSGRQFLLDAKTLALGSSYLRASGADGILLPGLRQVVALYGGAASISVLVGSSILYLASYSEERGIRPIARIGAQYPAFATAMGRVLMSELEPPALSSSLGTTPLRALTPLTEVDPTRLVELIAKARRDGYATAVDQLAYGVTSIAVPVLIQGKIVAALNSSGYTGQVTADDMVRDRLGELRGLARDAAETIVKHPVLYRSLAGPNTSL